MARKLKKTMKILKTVFKVGSAIILMLIVMLK